MNLYRLKIWFIEYDKWVNQARRKEALGKAWAQKDEILGITYHSREELDLKAEEMSDLLKEEEAKYEQWQAEGGVK